MSPTTTFEVDGPVAWYRLSPGAVADRLDTDPAAGLTGREATDRLERFGPNELDAPPRRPWWMLLLDQFRNSLILLLMVAAAVSLAVGDVKDPIVIAVVVVINAVLGFVQESRADRAMEALAKMLTTEARVRRDGRVRSIPTAELVPGDVVLLEAGDRIPADGRFVRTTALAVDEGTLTGESLPVDKDVDALDSTDAADTDEDGFGAAAELALAERANVGFMNTTLVRGTAELLVTETGMSTEVGRLAEMLSSDDPKETPLQTELEVLGRRLALVAGVAVAVVITVGLVRGDTFSDALLEGVALAVAAIPEGLPAVVTVTLALGVRRMAEHNAIVKRLASVETLGSTTVICSDKTGTLTLHQMTATRAWSAGDEYEVEGVGYGTTGGVEPAARPPLERFATAAALCSDAVIRESEGRPELVGDPTEGAMVVLAEKLSVDVEDLRERLPRRAELPFDSTRKLMAVVVDDPFGDDGGRQLLVKGAPDVVLDLSLDERAVADEVIDRFGREGLRVLAVAARRLPDDWRGDPEDELAGLELLGLVGILDPPRSEVGDAIALCRRAGVDVKMITGDHATTAEAIGRSLGLRGEVVTGAGLDALDDDELAERIESISMCARVSPEHKVRVVEALQANGEVVAMTGDGVNDAAALRRADIGVAMGITGTEVTKEAGDLVLADDNFSTIVAAVERGRAIRENIVHFVRFQLTTSLAAVGTILTARLIGLAAPFTPIQILFVNIIADGPPAMSLGVDPPAPAVMEKPPVGRTEPILDVARFRRILATVAFMTAAIVFLLLRHRTGDDVVASTMAFSTFVLAQLVNAFVVRSDGRGVFHRYTFTNAALWATTAVVVALQVAVVHVSFLQSLFGTTSLNGSQWLECLAVVGGLLVIEEVWIRLRRLWMPSA